MTARSCILCPIVGCATLGVAQAGPQYQSTQIGGPEVTATAINNLGQVTGSLVTATGKHAFLWNAGVLTDLGSIAGFDAVGLAINDAGEIAGNLTPQQGTGSLPFLYSNGVMRVLPTLDAGTSWCCYGAANAINNSGQVGGSSSTSAVSTDHVPVIWTNGVPQALGKSGPAVGVYGLNDYGQATGVDGVGGFFYSDGVVMRSGGTGGVALNNAGQVAGDYWGCFGGGCMGLAYWYVRLYADGSFQTLVGGGDDYGLAGGINNVGQAVFQAVTAGAPPPHLYLYANGSMIEFGYGDPDNKIRPAINDDGSIVTRSLYYYLLTPVTPYPSMVRVTAFPTTVTTGSPFTVAWTDQSVTACTASGGSSGDGWGGNVPTHGGQQQVTEKTAGAHSFTITCTGASAPVASTASVTVKALPPPPMASGSGGGGGGALDPTALSVLAVLVGVRAGRRRSRAVAGQASRP